MYEDKKGDENKHDTVPFKLMLPLSICFCSEDSGVNGKQLAAFWIEGIILPFLGILGILGNHVELSLDRGNHSPLPRHSRHSR